MRKKNFSTSNRTAFPAQEKATYSDACCPLVSHALCKTRAAYILLLVTNTITVKIVEK